MATTTLWVPGASARIGGNLDAAYSPDEVLNPRISEIIKGNEMFLRVLGTVDEHPLKATLYIPVPTISFLNNEQLYLKRFTVNLEFFYGKAPVTIALYDGVAKVIFDDNPVFTPTYECIFNTAHKINTSLSIGIELNVPPTLEGVILKIGSASFDLKDFKTVPLSANAFLLFMQ